ncbi:MAG: VOC family protein [Chloroflexaceae bacterium]|nr:VOC family protein [Chloroflexaceae bacterium]
MKTLIPYLNFGGRCREAMTFYKGCFQAEQLTMQTFADAGFEVPPPFQDYILHSELTTDGLVLRASDGRFDSPATVGDNISLNLMLNNLEEQERIFNSLAEGGTVDQPLQDAFWGDRFGQVTDQFGIHWMLICPKQAA